MSSSWNTISSDLTLFESEGSTCSIQSTAYERLELSRLRLHQSLLLPTQPHTVRYLYVSLPDVQLHHRRPKSPHTPPHTMHRTPALSPSEHRGWRTRF
ncbi:unnamed protein product, partial [Mycena citricolor]